MARTSKYNLTSEALQAANNASWRAGLYLRLSKEDGDKEDGDKFESDSIGNQRLIIEDFLAENPDITIFDAYADDGYSGTNFERPSFIRLIEDVRAGKINCVIVKDLSRFGRNYVEAGQYLEIFFPIMQVRFISVIDDIDSHINPSSMNNISVPFKNVMNEEYCRDISQKVKSTFNLKRENGEYIGGFSPYGYKKHPDNKNKLIVDAEAAEVVALIFRLFLEGNPVSCIGAKLNERGIVNPTTYKKLQGMNYRHPRRVGDELWSATTIRIILTNRMYIGDMVQGKREKVSHKVAKIRTVRADKWIIKEGTHEAIIDKTTFQSVQDMLRRDTRISTKQNALGLFAGFLKCADCGRALGKKMPNKYIKGDYYYYTCRTYELMKKSACTRHTVRSDRLEETVFAVVSKYIDTAADMDALIAKINLSPAKNAKSKGVQSALEAKEKEKAKAESILFDLYPDFKDGLISREQYLSLKEKHEAEVERLKLAIMELRKTQEAEKDGIDSTNAFLQNFLRFRHAKKLTREVLIALIDHIKIHEGGGIEISFKFQDAFLRATEYIEANQELLKEAL